MAETDGELAARKRRWKCLNHLTALLSEGTVRLEDLVSELENDQNNPIPPLEPFSFSRKGKRSPRTGSKPTHDEKPESSSARIKITFKNLPSVAGPLPCKRKKVSENALQKPKKKQPRFDIRSHIMTDQLPGPELPRLADPGLPGEFVEYIIRNNGRPESFVLLIEKKLFNTDLSPSHARLSVPICQVKRPFLLKEEVEKLKADRAMKVKLLQPNVEKCRLTLALWESNSTYVLNGGWTEVVDRNKLVIGTSVRLWSYRKTNSKLRFVLAKVE
ncbi:B3 domain-containing protein [Striga hermonthica]|uniref:B3 domain-containing protein n=1 Tax=Striga hermonthica TaxID=68872 RepID=A0A9N7R8P1_STRHE|nr:B3 domain-containing protein [Striga hermonthica]